MYLLNKLFNPEIYQGKYHRSNYFEGWYYKLVDNSKNRIISIIPGISFNKFDNDSHCFIQVIDSSNYNTNYFKFPLSKFNFSQKRFSIEIDNNCFDDKSMSLNIKDNNVNIFGTLSFPQILPYPKSLFNPGIMGPFSFIPFMECYHGIINIHHQIKGSLFINNKSINFDNGYGYIEKDWGHSFPKEWIWIQCNSFDTSNVSFMLSIAVIPWLGTYFIGFISFLQINDKIYKFATYNLSKIISMDKNNTTVQISLKHFSKTLFIKVNFSNGGLLKAPVKGQMCRDIIETLNADISLNFSDKNKVLFEGTGINCGLEIAGDIFEYFQ